MPAISAELKETLLKLRPEDCTVPFLISKITKTTSSRRDENGKRSFNVRPPEWNLQGTFKLKAGEYINVEEVPETTVGSFLFNKICIEGKVESIVPNHYYNEVVTKKGFGAFVNEIAVKVSEKKIPLMPNVTEFIQAFEFYGLMLCPGVSASLTKGTFSVDEELRKMRDELYAQAGENPSISQIVEIEDKLVKAAEAKLKGDPGLTLFHSGARGSFNDNYKMMSLTVGPVFNPATGKYDVVKSNYIDGIQKRELPAMGNVIVNAAYPKAIGTAEGGYITKQFYAVFQGIQLGEPGSDCGSKGYFTTFITPKNYSTYMWQYAVDQRGKLILMTDDNRDQFVNRVVRMRSPIGCLAPKICNKCMGERFYMLNIQNAGLTAGRLPNSIMNAGMKAFHNTKVTLHKVDPDKLLIA